MITKHRKDSLPALLSAGWTLDLLVPVSFSRLLSPCLLLDEPSAVKESVDSGPEGSNLKTRQTQHGTTRSSLNH